MAVQQTRRVHHGCFSGRCCCPFAMLLCVIRSLVTEFRAERTHGRHIFRCATTTHMCSENPCRQNRLSREGVHTVVPRGGSCRETHLFQGGKCEHSRECWIAITCERDRSPDDRAADGFLHRPRFDLQVTTNTKLPSAPRRVPTPTCCASVVRHTCCNNNK